MAQLVAHLVRDQEVARSSRVTQTEKDQALTETRKCLFYYPDTQTIVLIWKRTALPGFLITFGLVAILT